MNLSKPPIEQIQELLKIQLSDGNWNFDPYMHGMTNGIILCLSILEDTTPEFKEAPEQWLCETKEDKPVDYLL